MSFSAAKGFLLILRRERSPRNNLGYRHVITTVQRPWRNIDWQSAIIMWLIAQNEKVT